MTHEEKVEIFREIQREYHTEDAHRHVEEIIEFSDMSAFTITLEYLTDDDYGKMVSLFEDNYDCNISENDQWDNLIKDYVDMNGLIFDKDREVYKRYEKYKDEWVNSHISPEIMAETEDNYDCRSYEDKDINFKEYVEKYGFADGSLYACFEEFIDNELIDTDADEE